MRIRHYLQTNEILQKLGRIHHIWLKAWVEALESILNVCSAHMGIAISAADAPVAEHLLDDA